MRGLKLIKIFGKKLLARHFDMFWKKISKYIAL